MSNCPQMFKVIPLAVPWRTAKVGDQPLLQEHDWLMNILIAILHSSLFHPFVGTEHTAYSSSKTRQKCLFSQQKRPSTESAVEKVPLFWHLTAIPRISFGRPQLQQPTRIRTIVHRPHAARMKRLFNFFFLYLFNSSQVTAATMRVPN